MGPDGNTREQIAENNWKGIPFEQVKEKTQYVFAVKIPKEYLKGNDRDARDIYLFNLNLENLLLSLVDDWSLIEWTTDVPKVIQTGTFTLPTSGTGITGF